MKLSEMTIKQLQIIIRRTLEDECSSYCLDNQVERRATLIKIMKNIRGKQ